MKRRRSTPCPSAKSAPTRTYPILRAVDYGTSCVVQAEVFPAGGGAAVYPGPYTFADASQATAFVTEAVESLMYLGCDVYAE